MALARAVDGTRDPAAYRLAVGSSLAVAQRLRWDATLEGHEGCVNTLAWAQDGRILASAGDDLSVRLWEWPRGRALLEVDSGHSLNVFATLFLDGGGDFGGAPRLATCAADGEVRILACREGDGAPGRAPARGLAPPFQPSRLLGSHHLSAHALAQPPGAPETLASVGEDGVVRLWDLRAPGAAGALTAGAPGGPGGSLAALRTPKALFSLAFDPTSPHRFAVGGASAPPAVYDLRAAATAGPRPLRVARGRRDGRAVTDATGATAVAYARDGRLLVSYVEDDLWLFAPDAGGRGEPAESERYDADERGAVGRGGADGGWARGGGAGGSWRRAGDAPPSGGAVRTPADAADGPPPRPDPADRGRAGSPPLREGPTLAGGRALDVRPAPRVPSSLNRPRNEPSDDWELETLSGSIADGDAWEEPYGEWDGQAVPHAAGPEPAASAPGRGAAGPSGPRGAAGSGPATPVAEGAVPTGRVLALVGRRLAAGPPPLPAPEPTLSAAPAEGRAPAPVAAAAPTGARGTEEPPGAEGGPRGGPDAPSSPTRGTRTRVRTRDDEHREARAAASDGQPPPRSPAPSRAPAPSRGSLEDLPEGLPWGSTPSGSPRATPVRLDPLGAGAPARPPAMTRRFSRPASSEDFLEMAGDEGFMQDAVARGLVVRPFRRRLTDAAGTGSRGTGSRGPSPPSDSSASPGGSADGDGTVARGGDTEAAAAPARGGGAVPAAAARGPGGAPAPPAALAAAAAPRAWWPPSLTGAAHLALTTTRRALDAVPGPEWIDSISSSGGALGFGERRRAASPRRSPPPLVVRLPAPARAVLPGDNLLMQWGAEDFVGTPEAASPSGRSSPRGGRLSPGLAPWRAAAPPPARGTEAPPPPTRGRGDADWASWAADAAPRQPPAALAPMAPGPPPPTGPTVWGAPWGGSGARARRRPGPNWPRRVAGADPGELTPLGSFRGHRNGATIKGASFVGPDEGFVASGSDDGRMYIWRAKDAVGDPEPDAGGKAARLAPRRRPAAPPAATPPWLPSCAGGGAGFGAVPAWLPPGAASALPPPALPVVVRRADPRILNCVVPHPREPWVLASSGIAPTVGLWSPGRDEPLGPSARDRQRCSRNVRSHERARTARDVLDRGGGRARGAAAARPVAPPAPLPPLPRLPRRPLRPADEAELRDEARRRRDRERFEEAVSADGNEVGISDCVFG